MGKNSYPGFESRPLRSLYIDYTGKENPIYTKQVSIFLENKKGRIAEVTRLLAQEKINIRALSLGDTVDFGVLRIIVSDHDRCLSVLKAHDFTAQETEVIAVEVDDKPGGLYRVIQILEPHEINIEYMYAFFEKSGCNAIVVMKIDDADKAGKVLKDNSFSILTEDKIGTD
jgi:hypothetical protein